MENGFRDVIQTMLEKKKEIKKTKQNPRREGTVDE